MKIGLKNIHYSSQLSEETHAFTANLYINGIKAGVASNSGHGGNTDYHADSDKGRELIKQAEIYCKGLPPQTFTMDDKQYSIGMNLEHYIDKLLEDHLQQKELQKFRRKIEKAMPNHVIYGVPDQSVTLQKLNMPMVTILNHPRGEAMLKNLLLTSIIPKMKEEEKILNTNIPEKILKSAGLKSHQYTPYQQKKTSKRKGLGR